jgi:cobalt-precorrin 5A hydrolase
MNIGNKPHKLAIWIVTPNGTELADKLYHNLKDVDLYVSKNNVKTAFAHKKFEGLAKSLKPQFHRYSGHIFIMSTGIVVRVIAPLIKHKTQDPAVVVVDDGGNYAISLLSGHLGGANDLTRRVADIIGADPVITTATDVHQVPAIDVMAKEKNLFIENPGRIKTINMALLKGDPLYVHDPFDLIKGCLPNCVIRDFRELKQSAKDLQQPFENIMIPGVFIDDVRLDLPPQVLVLRPASLVAGIGCNRNTGAEEIKALLDDVLAANQLASSSLKCLASIDVKADEGGLIALADHLDRPLVFFTRRELNQVKTIQNPSALVEKHVGVKSVCEAAAILAARNGALIVPKQTTRNATVAIARIDFSSSASDRAVPST